MRLESRRTGNINLKNRKNQDKIIFRLQKLTRFLALFLKKEEKGTENRDLWCVFNKRLTISALRIVKQ